MGTSLPDDMCRLCAASGNLCVSVFGKDGDKILLRHKLRVCSPVTVKEDDVLPKQVCLTCLSSLDQSYDFYQQARNAQMKLEGLILMESKKKRHQHAESDDGKDDKFKRLCFGSTYMTYPSELHDKFNTENMTPEKSHPPLFVVMKSRLECSNAEGGTSSELQPQADSTDDSPCGSESLEENETRMNTPQNTCSKDSESSGSMVSKKHRGKPPGSRRVKKEVVSPMKSLPRSPRKQSAGSPSLESRSSSPKQSPPLSPKNSDSVEQTSTPASGMEEDEDGFKRCRFCERKFSPDVLLSHEALHLGKQVYHCDQCKSTFFNREAFTKHVSKRHEGGATNTAV